MIVQLLDEFVDCAWTDDGALVAIDMHGRTRLRIAWGGHQLPHDEKVLMLVDLMKSRIMGGEAPADGLVLDGAPRKARAR